MKLTKAQRDMLTGYYRHWNAVSGPYAFPVGSRYRVTLSLEKLGLVERSGNESCSRWFRISKAGCELVVAGEMEKER